jgi:hypothetical protein
MPILEKLISHKDKTVFRLLDQAVSPAGSIEENCGFREDLKQRMDSKSPAGEYVAVLYDLASYSVANEGA